MWRSPAAEADGDETVYVAIQREWADDAPGFVKIGRYDVAGEDWTFASYPLDAADLPGRRLGRALGAHAAAGRASCSWSSATTSSVCEARVKRLYRIDPASVEFAPPGADAAGADQDAASPTCCRTLDAASVSVPDKLEGVRRRPPTGRRWMVTDNDGVDEN